MMLYILSASQAAFGLSQQWSRGAHLRHSKIMPEMAMRAARRASSEDRVTTRSDAVMPSRPTTLLCRLWLTARSLAAGVRDSAVGDGTLSGMH